jgi:hypothetical protein
MYIGNKIVIFGGGTVNHHTPNFLLLFGRGESINWRNKFIHVSINLKKIFFA